MELTFKERQQDLKVFVKGDVPFNYMVDVLRLSAAADERIKELTAANRDLTKTIIFLRKTEKVRR